MPVFIPADKPKRVSMDQINFERNIIEKLEKADINNDGRYTKEELKKALKDLGSYYPGLRAIFCFMKADANKDGQISGEEIDTLIDYLLTRGFGKN
ncbi:putative flagellar calcium-binding protein calflagin [Medicago truncatula]|uniref:EF-hand protein n=1 Tax=Medicago truncatula TaxID=3880 RepID=G7I3M6_MEDTR|nr:calmodulin-like protein 4 [Medicago truncatula]AES59461.1 EF-hand protein [Medicago truncatula]AFK41045.1 unknown [Medicago truncatula]RHN77326.1 putative flagellar calcium-binding protein calflagin [Medicago truncatula]